MYFEYGIKEIEYLKSKDKKLAQAIELIGHVYRPVDSDLFSSIIYMIIGQQISTVGHKTVWKNLVELVGKVTPTTISNIDDEKLQGCGMTFRKVGYIKGFCKKVNDNEINIESLQNKSDAEVMEILSSIKGIGVWTVEMIMFFTMQRPDILSYGDLAILRGMRMLYRHRTITPQLFNKYKRRYSPYGSVASIYLWAIAAGKIEGLSDPGKKK